MNAEVKEIKKINFEDITERDAIMKEYAEYTIIKKQAEAQLKAIAAQAKAYMEEHNIRDIAGTEHMLKLVSGKNISFKREPLLEAFPDAAEFMNVTEFDYIKMS